jgi:protein-disulfide isomerase
LNRVLLVLLLLMVGATSCLPGGDDDDGQEIGCDPDDPAVEGCALDPNADGEPTEAATEPAEFPVEVTPAEPSDLFTGIQQDRLSLGSPGAEIELILYEDFQCPFCQRFTEVVLPDLIDEYVRPGTVRIVFHQVAALGPESLYAAMAAECAADQGRFWEYYEVLFANQGAENQGAFSKSNLKAFGALIDLDQATFGECVDSDRYLQDIEDSTQAAFDAGLTAAPAVRVGDRFLQGFQPYAIVSGQIESQLEQ